ncbi:MAG TPA: glycosyltransferase family 4 protein [Bacteroidota bacterium]|nr:glycosyltransferase family 4 protein [Bacteroidota bacterium]
MTTVAAPLTILQTCFSRSWGGLEIQALEVSAHLARHGHRVTLACSRESRLAREGRDAGLDVIELGVSGYVHPAAIWRLARIIRSREIQIVHCQHSRDLSLVVPAADISGAAPKIILSKRVGSYIHKRDLFHRYTYARVARVLAISEVIHRNVLETTPTPPDRVLTLHDAIDTHVFDPARADGGRIRREFGFSPETAVIGFVGRFSPGKGHEELLQAAATVHASRPGARFLIVGEASSGEEHYAEGIRRMSAELGLDGTVTFAGFRRDIPDLMAAFDILAFPSHAESFGVVLIEAMAMGLPVVSTNCDGVLDIVVDGETGIFVRPREPGEFASALFRLLDSGELRGRLGAAGRRRALDLFDRESQIGRLEKIYREVLA